MRIKILHLSDLHFTESSTSQDIICHSLYNKIKEMFSAGAKPNIIIITGDIVFSGKQKEYEKAKEYIDSIAQICEIKEGNIFIVPGNHDVDRGKIKPGHIKWWYNFPNEESLTENLSSPDSFPQIFRKMDDYFAFSSQYLDGSHSIGKYGAYISEIPVIEPNPRKINKNCWIK